MKRCIWNFLYCLILSFCIGIPNASAVPVGIDNFAADALLIDFEGSTTALPSIPGVSFPWEGPVNSPSWFSSTTVFDNTFFGNKVFSNLTNIGYSNLAIEFSDPVNAVGGWIGQIDNFRDANPESITFSIFGSVGLIEEIVVELPKLGFETPLFVGLASDIGITRVEWRNQNTGFFGVDNVIYGAVNTPEPSTLTLLLIGILGFAKILRPKKD